MLFKCSLKLVECVLKLTRTIKLKQQHPEILLVIPTEISLFSYFGEIPTKPRQKQKYSFYFRVSFYGLQPASSEKDCCVSNRL